MLNDRKNDALQFPPKDPSVYTTLPKQGEVTRCMPWWLGRVTSTYPDDLPVTLVGGFDAALQAFTASWSLFFVCPSNFLSPLNPFQSIGFSDMFAWCLATSTANAFMKVVTVRHCSPTMYQRRRRTSWLIDLPLSVSRLLL